MSGHTGHPGTDDLADLQAGMVSGTHGRWLSTHVEQCPVCASVTDQLAAVSEELAAAPALALPRQVERRIAAALLIEAATRDAAASQPGRDASGPQPDRRTRAWKRPVPLFSRAVTVPLGVLVPAVVCLLLAVGGYAVSLSDASPSHPVAEGASTASAPGSPASAARGPRSGAAIEGPGGSALRHDTLSSRSGTGTAFVVLTSGTDYQPATLQGQVREEIQVIPSPSVTPVPVVTGVRTQATSPQGQASATEPAGNQHGDTAPSGSLVGCVMRITDDREPALVDRASYESRPAYVIAVPSRVWVAPLTCTAAHPGVITSQPLSPAA